MLPEIGGPGQQKLKQARVLVIGAGGLGAPVLEYLAAAGVGTLGIVDDDTVSLSNLQRQVIHGTDTVGMLKTLSAKAAIARINPNTHGRTHTSPADDGQRPCPVAGYDIVVDGSDNFETRYAVADACASGAQTAGACRRRPLRRLGDGAEALRGRQGWQAEPGLSRSFSRSRRRPAWCRPAPRPACLAR